MRLVWVQQCSYLPVVVEDIDTIDPRQNRGTLPSSHLPLDNRLYSTDDGDSLATCRSPGTARLYHRPSYLTTMTANPRGKFLAHAALSHGFNPPKTLAAGFPTDMSGQQTTAYGQAQGHTAGGFNLAELTDALPPNFNQHEEVERSASGSSTTVHQQPPSPFAGQAPMTTSGYNMYPSQYCTPYQQVTGNTQAFPHPQANQTAAHNLGPNPVQAPFSGPTYYPHQQQQPYILYPNPYGQAGQHHPGLPTAYAQSFGRGTHQGFGLSPMSQPIPDVASIPGRVSQYGGFSPSGHLGYGLGSGAMFGRSGPVPGRFASMTISQTVS